MFWAQEYRTHTNGPLVKIGIEPGAVIVRMTADVMPCWVKMHRHIFDHDMICKDGSATLSLNGCVRKITAGEKVAVEAHAAHDLVFHKLGTVVECRHEHADIHPDKTDGDGIPMEWLDRLTEGERRCA